MEIFEDYINRDRPFDMIVTLISVNGVTRIHTNYTICEYKTVKGARIALSRKGYTPFRNYLNEE